jgi:hypothetical protein
MGTGLLCFFYDQKHDEVPAPVSTGEILIAYNVRIKAWRFDTQAWSTHSTRWKLISPGFNLQTLKIDEFAKVNELQAWWNTRGGAAGAKGDIIQRDKEGHVLNEEGPTRGKKANYIGGMQHNGFYDLVAEVVHRFGEDADIGCENLSWETDVSLCHGLYAKYGFV